MWTVSQLCPEMTPISGHVYRFEGARGPVWRAKYRLPDGRQVQRTIGPAWTERGRPRAGYFTKRTAEAWLRDVLDQARAGTLPGMVRTGVTFADACAEYLRYVEHDRDRKPSTLRDYRSSVARAPAAGVRRAAPRGRHGRATIEALEGDAAREQPHARSSCSRCCTASSARARRVYRLPAQPGRRRREAARSGDRRRSRSSRRRRCWRSSAPPSSEQDARDLPHRGVHRPAPRRAGRAALARRRLRRPRASASARATPAAS